MNVWDVLLVILILTVAALAILKCFRDKKRGKSCCGDCTKCGGCSR